MPNYKFNPSNTMTTKELGEILQVVVVSLLQAMQQRQPTGDEPLEIDGGIYDRLPEHLKSYFEIQPLTAPTNN